MGTIRRSEITQSSHSVFNEGTDERHELLRNIFLTEVSDALYFNDTAFGINSLKI